MVSKQSRSEIRVKKHVRLRNRFSGTAERPRLAVFRSNNHMYAQIIDDTVGNTLVAASTLQKDVKAELLAQGAEAMMIENCGMPDEKIYRTVEEIPEDAGYYSLIIIKENKDRREE